MTLPASFPISVSEINVELGRAAGAAFSITGAEERAIASVPSGAISFSDFLGKSSLLCEQVDSRTVAATSFATVNFGADIPGRGIILFAWHHDIGTNPGTTPSASIGGATTTRRRAQSTGAAGYTGDATGSAIFTADPSGSSGTVTVNWSSFPVTIVVLRTIGYNLVPTTTWGSNGGGGDLGNTDLVVPDKGLIAGMAGAGANSANMVWTGLTERGDESIGAADNKRSWAFDFNQPANGARNVVMTPWLSGEGKNSWAGLVLAPT